MTLYLSRAWRRTRSSRFATLFLACALAIVGLVTCGTATFVVQQYDGPELPADRIAVLRVNGGSRVVFVGLDGEELSYYERDRNSRVHIEVLPGVHEVDIGFVDDPFRRVQSVRFRAQPGKVYRVTIDSIDPASTSRAWRPIVWEVDRESDRALSAVVPASEATELQPTSSATRAPQPEATATTSSAPSRVVPPAETTSSPASRASAPPATASSPTQVPPSSSSAPLSPSAPAPSGYASPASSSQQ